MLRRQKNSITVALPQQGNVGVENETFTKKLKNSVQRYPNKREPKSVSKNQKNRKQSASEHPLSHSMQRDENVLQNYASSEEVSKARYEEIEEVSGRPIDEILLENLQIKNRHDQMKSQIKWLNNTIEKTNSYLHQLLQVELNLNPDISVPIANEYNINLLDFSYQENITNSEVLAEGLRKIRYYYHSSVEEWVEIVEKAKANETYFKTKHEQLKKELHQLQERNQMLEKAEERRKQKEREVLAKGFKIVVNDKKAKVVDTPKTEAKTQYSPERPIEEKVVYHSTEVNKKVPIKNVEKESVQVVQPSIRTTEEPVKAQKITAPIPSVPSNPVSPTPKKEDVVETPSSTPASSQEVKENTEKNTPPSSIETKVTYYQASEQDMLKELEKPVYMTLLDKKGYEYETCSKPHFNVLIKEKAGKVPLVYIDYTIPKSDVFNDIMSKTNQIYFLFDTDQNMKKGNAKFASWLLSSKRNKKDVKFSFNTMEELRTSGLDKLAHL